MFSKEWTSLLNEVSKFQEGKLYTWFRGQNDANFHLNSGLYRLKLENPSDYSATESAYFHLFKRMGYVHHREDDSWKLLFLMQHYGVKTRLLDWTESFAVALYFTTEGWEEYKDAAVWLLDPLSLNEKIIKEKVFYFPRKDYEEDILKGKATFTNNSMAIYPMRNSSRIISQQGMFTIQGKLGIPLEEEYQGKLFDEGILKKIIIPNSLRDDVFNYLKLAGISDFTLFPDLEGLAKYINKQGYFNNRREQDKLETENLIK